MIFLKKGIASFIAIVLFMLLAFVPDTVLAYDEEYEAAKEFIISELESFTDEVYIGEYYIEYGEVKELFTEIIKENPRLFYVKSECQIAYYEEDGVNIADTIYFEFKYSDSELRIKVNDFNSRIRLISEEIMKSETDLERIHSCHDYIVKNYSYDETKESWDVYNMLLTGSGTCMAYTGLFGCIMDECGIENTVATAKSEDMNHIWNVVKLDGKYYNVDVTWDDPIGLFFSTSHEYLLKSDSYFDSHGYEGRESELECTDTKYDSYSWADESIFTQIEGVDDVLEYAMTSIPLIFAISVSALVLIIVIVVLKLSKKRKDESDINYW